MKVRILTGLCIAALGIPLLIFSKFIIYPIVLSLLALFALYEFYRVMGTEKKYWLTAPTYLFALAFPLLAYFLVKGGEAPIFVLAYVTLALVVYMFYGFFVAVLNYRYGTVGSVDVMKCFSPPHLSPFPSPRCPSSATLKTVDILSRSSLLPRGLPISSRISSAHSSASISSYPT